MRFAIIRNGAVVNVAMADHALDEMWIPTDVAGIGWTYFDGVFTNPDEPPTMDLGGGGGPIEPG